MAGTTLKNENKDVPDLTQPDELSDVTLVVEERKLYTNKAFLMSASPVWRRMFTSDFKEKNTKEIPVPGKNFDDILELLLCLTPATQKGINGYTVFRILPLTEEYQMQKLKRECVQYLLQQLSIDGYEIPNRKEDKVKCVSLAQKYGLKKLLEESTKAVSKLPITWLKKCKEYPEIEPETMVRILDQRVLALEQFAESVPNHGGCNRKCSCCGSFTDFKKGRSQILYP